MPTNRTRVVLKTIAWTLATLGLLGGAGGVLLLKSGWYNVGSTDQHFQITHSVLEQAMRQSVAYRARTVALPPGLGAPAQVRQGARIYRDHCAQCHGAPGVAQRDFARSMQPVPGPLVDAARRWRSPELYWITRHGIKMSGMPAWEYHLADADLWAVVAFMGSLPALGVADYAALTSPAPALPSPAEAARPASAVRGRTALTQYACNACHIIPGVTGSRVYVGRPLTGLAKRAYIAGNLPNTKDNLVRWIRNPQSVDPHTAMPMLSVTENDANDMSAYLLSQ